MEKASSPDRDKKRLIVADEAIHSGMLLEGRSLVAGILLGVVGSVLLVGIPGLFPGLIPGADHTTTLTSLGTVHLTSTVTATATMTVTSSPPVPQPVKWLAPRYEVISYLEAGRYAGQRKTIEGTIVKAYRAELDTVFLNFHDPDRGYFTAIIFSNALSKFKFTPEDFYSGKEVRVSGIIQSYEGSPKIIVESPSQIEVAYMGFSYP